MRQPDVGAAPCRARIRRAAGASLLAVVVAAAAVSVVSLAHEHAPGHSASYSGPPLPATFTASDGAFYRQMGAASMAGPAQGPAAIKVAAGSYPVDVMAACGLPTFRAAPLNRGCRPVTSVTTRPPARERRCGA